MFLNNNLGKAKHHQISDLPYPQVDGVASDNDNSEDGFALDDS